MYAPCPVISAVDEINVPGTYPGAYLGGVAPVSFGGEKLVLIFNVKMSIFEHFSNVFYFKKR